MSASEIPANWAGTKIGELFEFCYGKALSKSNRSRAGSVPVYGSNGITGYHDQPLIEGPCLLVGRKGAAGKVSKALNGCWPIDTTYYVKVPDGLDFEFCVHLFQVQRFEKFEKSTAIPSLSRDDAYGQEVTIPPLPEQRRIVAKIEELFSELDKGIENLKQARAQLAVYRHALLKHAFEGKLTAVWRAGQKRNVESTEELLARILAEREERFQCDLRAWNNRAANAELIHNSELPTKPRKPKPPYRLDSDVVTQLARLPVGWNWMVLENLASPAQRSIQSGPFGSSLKHSEFSETGILVIGIDNVQSGYFSKGSQNRIPLKTYARLRKYSARPHDVLVTVMATVGRCCSVPSDLEPAIITKHVYRTSPNLALVLPSFLVNALLGSPATVKAIEKDKVGQTRPGINGDILKWLPIPLAPIDEQQEILRIVNANLDAATAMEADIDANLQKSEALRQAILKKAFAGELVPQDPADEPATALLARIRAERAAQAGTSPKRRGASTKSK